MFCKYCGKELSSDSAFCSGCGMSTAEPCPEAKAEPIPAPAPAEPVDADEANVSAEEREDNKDLLVMGIVALALAVETGLGGVIAGGLAKRKAVQTERKYGKFQSNGKVGRILGNTGFGVGLGLSILLSVLYTAALSVYILMIINIIINGGM